MTNKEKTFNNLIAGGIAGTISRTIVAPFDKVKIFPAALAVYLKVVLVGTCSTK